MKTFILLSHEHLFRVRPSSEEVLALLEGVSFRALKQVAGEICHNLVIGQTVGTGIDGLHDFSIEMIRRRCPEPLQGRILATAGHRREFRGEPWVFADPHRVACLVAAYVRANPNRPDGKALPHDFARVFQAQLMLNDLLVPPGAPGQGSDVAEVLFIHSMSRGSTASATAPRSYDLIARRLLQAVPGLDGAFRAHFGMSAVDALTILKGVYSFEYAAMAGKVPNYGGPRVPSTLGLLSLAKLRATHAGEALVRRALEFMSHEWNKLSLECQSLALTNPSILSFLRRPFIRLSKDELWNFDPGLLLSAASDGLFWLCLEAWKTQGGDGGELFRAFGKPVFEDYLRDLFAGLGATWVASGDADVTIQGPSDFYVPEREGNIVVLEAKASVMAEHVMWSGDGSSLARELKKITKRNQIMRAVERYVRRYQASIGPETTITPLIVVRDWHFASPGIETEVNRMVTKPALPCKVRDVQVLSIGDLEVAGNYVREKCLGRLLKARAGVTLGEASSLESFIEENKTLIAREVGRWLPVFDAHVLTRKEMQAAMNRVFAQHATADEVESRRARFPNDVGIAEEEEHREQEK